MDHDVCHHVAHRARPGLALRVAIPDRAPQVRRRRPVEEERPGPRHGLHLRGAFVERRLGPHHDRRRILAEPAQPEPLRCGDVGHETQRTRRRSGGRAQRRDRLAIGPAVPLQQTAEMGPQLHGVLRSASIAQGFGRIFTLGRHRTPRCTRSVRLPLRMRTPWRSASPIGTSKGTSRPADLVKPSFWLAYTLRWPTMRNAVPAHSAAYTPRSVGSSSIPITAAAIGVLAAAASTETNPKAANTLDGRPAAADSAAPLVAPMKKIGVTMPPLPPVSSVTAVATILKRKARTNSRARPASADSMTPVPRPAYDEPAAVENSASAIPPP